MAIRQVRLRTGPLRPAARFGSSDKTASPRRTPDRVGCDCSVTSCGKSASEAPKVAPRWDAGEPGIAPLVEHHIEPTILQPERPLEFEELGAELRQHV